MAAAVFVAVLLVANVANLQHLIFTSDVWAIALFMLWFFNGIVFAGVQCGVAVMLLAEKDDNHPRGGLQEPIAIPVPATQKRRPFK